MIRSLVFLWLVFFALPAWAAGEVLPRGEMMGWLQRIGQAAHQLNYSGTIVYQHDGKMETARMLHLRDEAGEHEKLETLDGALRQVIRTNDEVKCYLADQKPMVIDRRGKSRAFPGLQARQFPAIVEHYQMRRLGQERVAGFDCQILALEPRDAYRYGHRLWVHPQTGLLLRISTLGERGELVEQSLFTQLTLNPPLTRDQFKPSRLLREADAQPPPPVRDLAAGSPWQVGFMPPGFRKTAEMQRTLPGKSAVVQHLVYSDGLAAISIFIEPAGGEAVVPHGGSAQGAIHVFARAVAGHQVTVLGEVPAVTVRQVGEGIALRVK